jgi:nucleoside 2-deoxyribosyltransferase
VRIYLASRYSRYLEMQAYRADLEAAGHVVTSRWINGDHQIDDAGLSLQAKEEERIRFAQEDLHDLVTSDCVISFTEAPRSSNSRGGRHVEYGMALALGKRCIVVGHRENVFHCLPTVEFFQTWDEARPEFQEGNTART